MMGFMMTLLSSSMSCTLAIFSSFCTLLAPVPSKAANYKTQYTEPVAFLFPYNICAEKETRTAPFTTASKFINTPDTHERTYSGR